MADLSSITWLILLSAGNRASCNTWPWLGSLTTVSMFYHLRRRDLRSPDTSGTDSQSSVRSVKSLLQPPVHTHLLGGISTKYYFNPSLPTTRESSHQQPATNLNIKMTSLVKKLGERLFIMYLVRFPSHWFILEASQPAFVKTLPTTSVSSRQEIIREGFNKL